MEGGRGGFHAEAQSARRTDPGALSPIPVFSAGSALRRENGSGMELCVLRVSVRNRIGSERMDKSSEGRVMGSEEDGSRMG